MVTHIDSMIGVHPRPPARGRAGRQHPHRLHQRPRGPALRPRQPGQGRLLPRLLQRALHRAPAPPVGEGARLPPRPRQRRGAGRPDGHHADRPGGLRAGRAGERRGPQPGAAAAGRRGGVPRLHLRQLRRGLRDERRADEVHVVRRGRLRVPLRRPGRPERLPRPLRRPRARGDDGPLARPHGRPTWSATATPTPRTAASARPRANWTSTPPAPAPAGTTAGGIEDACGAGVPARMAGHPAPPAVVHSTRCGTGAGTPRTAAGMAALRHESSLTPAPAPAARGRRPSPVAPKYSSMCGVAGGRRAPPGSPTAP